MATWIRKNGSEVELQNTPDHRAYGRAKGWEPKDSLPKVAEDIDNTQNKQFLANLVREHNGKTLDLRGSIDKVREKAKAMMEAE